MIFRRKNMPSVKTPAPGQLCVPAQVTPCASEDSNGSRRKILVVDDDPVVVQALSIKLKSEGYSVVSASDGSEALQATRSERPDLMLVDVDLPPDVGGVAWTGFSLTEWVRRMEEARNTPVILISASNKPDYHQRASSAGASAFLPKPIEKDLLLASIDKALLSAPPPSAPAAARRPEVATSLARKPLMAKTEEPPPRSECDFGL